MAILDEFIEPIFDRTQEDVDTLKVLLNKGYKNFTDEEKELWKQSLKGAFNVSDINRIENNIYVLSSYLNIEIDKKIYAETDIPTWSDFLRIRNNLIDIVEYSNLGISPGDVPELPYNTYEKINIIERLMFEIYNLFINQFVCYCGNNTNPNSMIQLYCGSAEY